MKEFITNEGGKRLVINDCDFKSAIALKNIIFSKLKAFGIDMESLNFKDVLNTDLVSLISKVKDILIDIDTDKNLNDAIFDCLKKSTYDNKAINEALFDNMPEARVDYYEIIEKCIEVTLTPFIKSLISRFKTHLSTMSIKNQESDTTQIQTNL